jgi:hypothetical protein
MRRIRRWTAEITLAGLTALALTSCAGDKPAVCTQADELRTSVQNLKDVNLSENGVGALSAAMGQVRVEFEQFRTAAGSQFQAQIDAVKAAADQLEASVAAAKAEPNAALLGAVGTSLGGLETAARSLQDAVAGTC